MISQEFLLQMESSLTPNIISKFSNVTDCKNFILSFEYYYTLVHSETLTGWTETRQNEECLVINQYSKDITFPD